MTKNNLVLKILGNLLFWATLISPIFSFYLASNMGDQDLVGLGGMMRYSWIMFLFMPLSILSIFIAILLKKNKQKYIKNLIIAFICLPILAIFGSYMWIFSDSYSYDTNKVSDVEQIIKLNLPTKVKVSTLKTGECNLTYAKIIDDNDIIEFENEIENNSLWQNNLKVTLKNLLPSYVQGETEFFDVFVFYNVTSDEYNTFPSKGENEYIFVAYDYDFNKLMIIDDYVYTLDQDILLYNAKF